METGTPEVSVSDKKLSKRYFPLIATGAFVILCVVIGLVCLSLNNARAQEFREAELDFMRRELRESCVQFMSDEQVILSQAATLLYTGELNESKVTLKQVYDLLLSDMSEMTDLLLGMYEKDTASELKEYVGYVRSKMSTMRTERDKLLIEVNAKVSP